MSLVEPFLLPENSSRPGDTRLPLVMIVGPTAVGKTELSIQLAQMLAGEIVSADSRLFYRGMDIGTAKPTAAERARVPHHLIDVANPDETWSLATFQERAFQTIAEIHSRLRLPFLVGGTGQYLRAVAHGWQGPRVGPDLRLRTVLEAWAAQIGPEGLHARLAWVDPEAATKIDPPNLRRTVRALEVIFNTGQLFSAQRLQGTPPYRLLTIGLLRPRPDIYARIDERISAMLRAGLVDEVRSLLALGYSPELPSFSAIGYSEIISYLQGDISLEEAVSLIQRNSRIFVRRQANWFKLSDPNIHWVQAGPEALDEVSRLIQLFVSPA